jgi:hypothetical protein
VERIRGGFESHVLALLVAFTITSVVFVDASIKEISRSLAAEGEE